MLAGTSVAVYGSIWRNQESVSSYTIDNSIQGVHISPISNHTLYNILFYQSPPLEDAPHILVINFTADTQYVNPTTQTQFWLDYFLYMPHVSSSSSSSQARKASSVPVGGIVGAVIGGVVIIGFCIFLGIWRSRRKNRTGSPPSHHPDSPEGGKESFFDRAGTFISHRPFFSRSFYLTMPFLFSRHCQHRQFSNGDRQG